MSHDPTCTPSEDPAPEAGLAPAVAAKLVDNHRAFLAFLERRVGSRAEAEDLLQEAFVKSLERGEALRDSESAVAWMYRMLRNAVIDRHRRRGAAEKGLARLAREMDEEFEPPREFVETACGCVRALSDALKPEYADALRRIDVEGLAVRDYGDQVGITANNAAVRVFRAREALRKLVVRSCGTCAEHGCLSCTCGASGSTCSQTRG